MYKGFLGYIRIQSKMKYLRPKRGSDKQAIVRQWSTFIAPAFIGVCLEMRLLKSYGQVSKSLRWFPTMAADSQYFKMCENGDLKALQEALSRREVSTFIVNDRGQSLIH